MIDRESVMQALKDSLRNQYCGFIENVGNVYAVSEETINDTLKLLEEQESVIEALKSDLDETLAVLGEQPEIVRCKDCKSCFEKNGMYFCASISYDRNELVDKDWFCANGDRR